MAVAQSNQQGSGIGYGRKAGFREQAHVVAIGKEGEEGLYLRRGGVLVELVEFKFPDVPLEAGRREEPACSARLLHYKAGETGQDVQDRSGQDIGRISLSEGRGDQI